jgi:hypothetical protein
MMFGSAELQRNPNPSDNKRSWNGWKSMMSKILLDTLYSFIQQLSQRVRDLRLEEPDLTQNHSFGGDFTECTLLQYLDNYKLFMEDVGGMIISSPKCQWIRFSAAEFCGTEFMAIDISGISDSHFVAIQNAAGIPDGELAVPQQAIVLGIPLPDQNFNIPRGNNRVRDQTSRTELFYRTPFMHNILATYRFHPEVFRKCFGFDQHGIGLIGVITLEMLCRTGGKFTQNIFSEIIVGETGQYLFGDLFYNNSRGTTIIKRLKKDLLDSQEQTDRQGRKKSDAELWRCASNGAAQRYRTNFSLEEEAAINEDFYHQSDGGWVDSDDEGSLGSEDFRHHTATKGLANSKLIMLNDCRTRRMTDTIFAMRKEYIFLIQKFWTHADNVTLIGDDEGTKWRSVSNGMRLRFPYLLNFDKNNDQLRRHPVIVARVVE